MERRKPLKADPAKTRAWQDRSRRPLARKAFWKSGKGQLVRRTAMARQNVRQAARRAKAYRKVLASDFHKQLRYAAFLRSGGLCECEQCVGIRKRNATAFGIPEGAWIKPAGGMWASDEVTAHSEIPCWFTKCGKEPWQRFRSTDGELHHTSYKYLGKENPDELRLVQWVWRDCHKRIEAKYSTRRRYLQGSK